MLVGGQVRGELDAATEQSGDGVCVGDGAWRRDGSCDVHRDGPGGTHGMRGDGVGVGDVGEVPGGAWDTWYPAGGDDGGGARGQRDRRVVGRSRIYERDPTGEPSGDGSLECNSSRRQLCSF